MSRLQFGSLSRCRLRHGHWGMDAVESGHRYKKEMQTMTASEAISKPAEIAAVELPSSSTQ